MGGFLKNHQWFSKKAGTLAAAAAIIFLPALAWKGLVDGFVAYAGCVIAFILWFTVVLLPWVKQKGEHHEEFVEMTAVQVITVAAANLCYRIGLLDLFPLVFCSVITVQLWLNTVLLSYVSARREVYCRKEYPYMYRDFYDD